MQAYKIWENKDRLKYAATNATMRTQRRKKTHNRGVAESFSRTRVHSSARAHLQDLEVIETPIHDKRFAFLSSSHGLSSFIVVIAIGAVASAVAVTERAPFGCFWQASGRNLDMVGYIVAPDAFRHQSGPVIFKR